MNPKKVYPRGASVEEPAPHGLYGRIVAAAKGDRDVFGTVSMLR